MERNMAGDKTSMAFIDMDMDSSSRIWCVIAYVLKLLCSSDTVSLYISAVSFDDGPAHYNKFVIYTFETFFKVT